jgi:hypothetical protein
MVIFTVSPKLSGRSKRTADFAEAYHKPWILTYRSSDRGDRVFVADGGGDGVADSRNDAGNAVGPRVCSVLGVKIGRAKERTASTRIAIPATVQVKNPLPTEITSV